ncbi:tRNA lysidine(34) synthetase TilS [Aquicoccus sp. SCR17]|nr:tRNA lysidine(34) synthetase TilS [Carideicomes alvinocaridis]
MTDRPGAALARFLEAHFSDARPLRLGVAVSGGGDSMALLDLAQGWAAERGTEIAAVTVDHRLREDSAGEAQAVARYCARLGIRHDVLAWQGWDGRGNLEAEARRARYAAMARWGRDTGMAGILLGHTRDDQAETILMRLAREAGGDGLRGMRQAFRVEGGCPPFLRPLLEVGRAELRDHLRARDIAWAEDPMNDDPRFDRVRARRALEALGPLGLGAERLAAVAANLRAENELLRQVVAQTAEAQLHEAAGALVLPRAVLADMQPELRRRLLQAAIGWIGGAPYPPRRDSLRQFIDGILAGETRMLGGIIALGGERLWLAREPAALPPTCPAGPEAVWDGRWRLHGPWGELAGAAEIGALGADGLRARPDWRAAALPRQVALGLPALWHDGTLLAVPHLDGGGWRADTPRDTFAAWCRAH